MRRYKLLGVGLLTVGLIFTSTAPSQALNPIPYLIPAEAGVVTGAVGVSAGLASGVGETLALGYGIYWASTQVAHLANMFFTRHASTASDPDSLLLDQTKSGTHYTQKFQRGDLSGTTRTWQDVEFKGAWVPHTYTYAGGGTLAGFTPTFNTGVSPSVSGSIVCGISWRNALGVVEFYQSTGALDDQTDLGGANQSQVQSAQCTTDFQTAITNKGINGTTIVVMSMIVGYSTAGVFPDTNGSFSSWNGAGFNVGQVQITSATQFAYAQTICKDGSGTPTTFTSGNVTLPATGSVSAMTVPACPVGQYTDEVRMIQNNNGVLSRSYDWKNNASVSYPSCATTTKCTLEVRYKTLSCTGNVSDACVNWYTNQKVVPADYTCYWGTYALPTMSSCAILKNQYDPTATLNSEGLANAPAPAVAPVAPTNDTTQSPTFTDTNLSGCAPSGWNLLNPFAFVGELGCVLHWAIVPDAETLQASVTDVKNTWSASSVGTFTTAMVSLPLALVPFAGDDPVSCQGPPLTIAFGTIVSTDTYYPLDACSAPLSGVASTMKLLEGILIGFGGIVLVWNTFAGALSLPKINFKPESWQQETLF